MPRLVVVLLLSGLICGESIATVAAQETPPTAEEPKAEPPALDPLDEEIPYSLLLRLQSNSGNVRSTVTPEQIQEMRNAAYEDSHISRQLSQLLSQYSTPNLALNSRFANAVKVIQREREERLRVIWLQMMTPEQRSYLRRRNRELIAEAARNNRFSSSGFYGGSSRIDAELYRTNLLSVIESPKVQDALDLSDEQLLRIDELLRDAEADAIRLVRQALDGHPVVASERRDWLTPDPEFSTAYKQLNEATLQVLTPEQATEYKRLLADDAAKREMGGAQVRNREPPIFLPHGICVAAMTRFQNGKATVEAEIHNVFASPTLVRHLKLDEAQTNKIAAIVEEARPRISRERELALEARFNWGDLTERIAEHNLKYHLLVLEMLTAEQMTTIESERLKGLGIEALRNSDVVAAIGLSEEGHREILRILDLPRPQMQQQPLRPANPTFDPEEFFKSSEEFHRRSREHSKLVLAHLEKQRSEIAAILTADQREKFRELTGLDLTASRAVPRTF